MRRPPRSADYFLRFFCKKDLLEEIKGDLLETYQYETAQLPAWRAQLFYWQQVLLFLRPFAFKGKNSKSTIMIFNHLKIAKRNLLKHKLNTTLNVLSLSVGIACTLAVAVYVSSELAYDNFHKDADLIYRVPIDFVDEKGNRIPDATTPPALAPAMRNDFPEVAQSVRIFPNWGNRFLLATADGKRFFESGFYRTDSTFFEIFTFDFIYGDPETALDGINDMVITKSMAEKYFGTTDAMGKSILRPDVEDHPGYTITAVIEDVPSNSHFQFDFLSRLTFQGIDENWGWYNYYTYIKLHPNTDVGHLAERLQPFYESYEDAEVPNLIYIQALTDIHLKSHLKWELGTNGDINNLYIFSLLAGFILLISCINYLNLTLAQSVRRLKEVGVRKVFGATKNILTQQFLIETLLVCLLAIIAGGIMAELFLHSLADLLGRDITLLHPTNWFTIGTTSCFVLMVGLIAGIAPVSKLVRSQIVEAMNQKSLFGHAKKIDVRKLLLILQFSLSIFILSATVVVYQQLDFMKTSDKGLDPEQVLVIENADVMENFQPLKNALLAHPNIKSVTQSDGIIGKLNWTTGVGYPDRFVMNYMVTDPDFLETLDLKLIAGRNFSPASPADREGWTMVVNETAYKELGLTDDQVGTSIPITEDNDSIIYGRILGVVADFRFTDYKLATKPFAFFYRENPKDFAYVKVNGNNLRQTLGLIEDEWQKVESQAPLEYFFLDQTYEELVTRESRLGEILMYLAAISVLIAVMGMLAMVKIQLKDQLKAIAIRKVLGASEAALLRLISSRFVVLVLAANLLALPMAYYSALEWLNGFTERIHLDLVLPSTILVSTIAMVSLAVSLQAIRTTKTNPTETLRQNS